MNKQTSKCPKDASQSIRDLVQSFRHGSKCSVIDRIPLLIRCRIAKRTIKEKTELRREWEVLTKLNKKALLQKPWWQLVNNK